MDGGQRRKATVRYTDGRLLGSSDGQALGLRERLKAWTEEIMNEMIAASMKYLWIYGWIEC